MGFKLQGKKVVGSVLIAGKVVVDMSISLRQNKITLDKKLPNGSKILYHLCFTCGIEINKFGWNSCETCLNLGYNDLKHRGVRAKNLGLFCLAKVSQNA